MPVRHSLSKLLLMYAQQSEDQHAPQNMTIALREAAKELDRLRAEVERLRAALEPFACECSIEERCAVPDNCRNFQARRAAITGQETGR